MEEALITEIVSQEKQHERSFFDCCLLSSVQKWFVLYTKSRHEKFVESALIKKGIGSFTPSVLLSMPVLTIRSMW